MGINLKPAARRLAGAALAAGLGLAGLAAQPGAAVAAGTTTLCGGGGLYTGEAFWQTSTQWGRAGERLCWEYSDTQVRAVGQLRIDWPSDCTLTAGLQTAEVSCPTREAKLGRLTFYSVQVPLELTGPDGVTHPSTCTWDNQTAFDMDHKVWTCTSDWVGIQQGGAYRGVMTGAGGDIKHDGDGLKLLDTFSRTLHFT